ncbi:hypothetical protein [Archangium sp.]|jgi:hypothetical protein|uniref:hypothetical protein n=1 Tax=Archangium sp. TaxID=1872627 RepID=UPI003899E2B1
MRDKQIFQDAYFTVLVDEQIGIVRTIRSSTPFASLEELDGVFARLGDALDALGRSRYGLLADLRAGPGRNDPQFEAAMERLRPRWTGGFRRVGVLVRSTVGLLQIQRHARSDGFERMISKHEDELLTYLTRDV